MSTSDIPHSGHRLPFRDTPPPSSSYGGTVTGTAGKIAKTERTEKKSSQSPRETDFRHESGAASRRIRPDIDWIWRAHRYSTQKLKIVRGGLCGPDKTPHPQVKSADCILSLAMLTSKAASCLRAVWGNCFYFSVAGQSQRHLFSLFNLPPQKNK